MLTSKSDLLSAIVTAGVMLAAAAQPSEAASDVFATFKDVGTLTSGASIVTLSVPPGKYAIAGKINLDSNGPVTIGVTCRLQAGADFDQNRVNLTTNAAVPPLDKAVMSFLVVHTFPVLAGHSIAMSCTFAHSGDPVTFLFAKITAVRLDGALCNKPSPAVCP